MIIQFILTMIGVGLITSQFRDETNIATWLPVVAGCVLIAIGSLIRGIQIGEGKS